jgi:hypothetical protein
MALISESLSDVLLVLELLSWASMNEVGELWLSDEELCNCDSVNFDLLVCELSEAELSDEELESELSGITLSLELSLSDTTTPKLVLFASEGTISTHP